MRRFVVTLAAVAMLSAPMAVAPSAASAQTSTGDGLVNVAIGDVTVKDAVDIGVAAQIVAQICGVKVGPIAVLATQVDRSGNPSRVICETGPTNQPVTITN